MTTPRSRPTAPRRRARLRLPEGAARPARADGRRVSTLAPIFAAAGIIDAPLSAFFIGLAAPPSTGISMGLAEALSDDELDHRRRHLAAHAVTGMATAVDGVLHAFVPGPGPRLALNIAYGVVMVELLAIAFIRFRSMRPALTARSCR